mgnify:CR=1 FL=1
MQQLAMQTHDTASGIKITFTKYNYGPLCLKGSKASTNYTGQLLNGTVFDSNVIAKFGHVQPFDFTVGAGQVIPCWDKAVADMSPGDKAIVYCPAATAYGDH